MMRIARIPNKTPTRGRKTKDNLETYQMKNKIEWKVRRKLASATTYWHGFYEDEFLFLITGHWNWIGGTSYALAYVPNSQPRESGVLLDALKIKAEERLNWALQMQQAEVTSDPFLRGTNWGSGRR